MPRRSATEVAGSRAQTLAAAVQLASVVGLEGLTIGRLADRLGMSKSGLVGRFGSKEQLQLATLDQAADIFRRTVYEPAVRSAAGTGSLERNLRRLGGLPGSSPVSRWLLSHHGDGGVRRPSWAGQRRGEKGDAAVAWPARARGEHRDRERRASRTTPTPKTSRSRSTRSQWEPTATSSSTATRARSSAPGEQWPPCLIPDGKAETRSRASFVARTSWRTPSCPQ